MIARTYVCITTMTMPENTKPSATAKTEEAATPSYSPLYRQIKNLIIASLRSAEWKPGEVIPGEIELAARFGVSQGTVRKAIDELSAENLLVRKQGKGTFVATHHEEKIQYRFLRLQPNNGEVRPLHRRFIDCQSLKAPANVASVLQLKGDKQVLEIRRVLSSDQAPVVLDEIWLPYKLFETLTAQRLSKYRGPMYALFESEYGVRMIRATEQISAIAATKDVAALLQVDEGLPLLQVLRTSYTYGDVPVEYRRGFYRTEDYYYRNELN